MSYIRIEHYIETPVVGYSDGIIKPEPGQQPQRCYSYHADERVNPNDWFCLDAGAGGITYFNVHPYRSDLGGYPVRWTQNEKPEGWTDPIPEPDPEPAPTGADTLVTLNKGGEAEETLRAGDIQIPDLWHLVEALREEARTIREKVANWNEEDEETADGEYYSSFDVASDRSRANWLDQRADDVSKVWHLAHDLKRHITGEGS